MLFGLTILTLLLLAGSFPAGADDASLGRLGEGVYPLEETTVQLTEEQVQLEVTPENTRVDVLFVFTNPGAEQVELLLGFPEGEKPDPEREEFRDDLTLHDFRAFVEGQEVAVERREGVKPPQAMVPGDVVTGLQSYSAWYTFPLSLAPGERGTVRNTYQVKNTRWSNDEVETGYILKTGALWAGSINNVQVKARLEGIRPDQVLGARPGNWTTARGETDVYSWEFSDWEPDRDIKLHFSVRPSPAFWQEFPGVDKLLLAGQYEEALQDLAKFKVRSDWSVAEVQGLAFREALALQVAGKIEAAEALWEELLYSAANDEPRDGSYRVADDPAAYYYLAETYLQKQDFDSLQGLYDLLRYNRVSPSLLRWLEFQLPAPVKTGVLAAGAHFRLAGKQPVIDVEAQDDRGSLDKGTVRVWLADEGGQRVLLEEEWEVYYGQGFQFTNSYGIPDLAVPGTRVNFLVTASNADGRQAETTGGWTLPESDSEWGNPLGPLKIEGRVHRVAAGKEFYYELAGYVLVPPEKWAGLDGYRIAARGTVTDQVLDGKKVLVLQDFDILDKGEPVPPPAAKQPGAQQPPGKVGDLSSRQGEPAPLLVKARPFTFWLDNRGVGYVSFSQIKKVEFRSQPLVLNGHLLVDMLDLTEMLDVSLGYHPGSNVITFEGRARPLKLGIEDNTYSSGTGVGSHNSAVIRHDGRIYVPLRFILEHYGYQVDYDPVQRVINAHG